MYFLQIKITHKATNLKKVISSRKYLSNSEHAFYDQEIAQHSTKNPTQTTNSIKFTSCTV